MNDVLQEPLSDHRQVISGIKHLLFLLQWHLNMIIEKIDCVLCITLTPAILQSVIGVNASSPVEAIYDLLEESRFGWLCAEEVAVFGKSGGDFGHGRSGWRWRWTDAVWLLLLLKQRRQVRGRSSRKGHIDWIIMEDIATRRSVGDRRRSRVTGERRPRTSVWWMVVQRGGVVDKVAKEKRVE